MESLLTSADDDDADDDDVDDVDDEDDETGAADRDFTFAPAFCSPLPPPLPLLAAVVALFSQSYFSHSVPSSEAATAAAAVEAAAAVVEGGAPLLLLPPLAPEATALLPR